MGRYGPYPADENSILVPLTLQLSGFPFMMQLQHGPIIAWWVRSSTSQDVKKVGMPHQGRRGCLREVSMPFA